MAFWNVVVSNAIPLFGMGGGLCVLALYLIFGKRDEATTVDRRITARETGGDVVGGNKVTGLTTPMLALILGAILVLVALVALVTGEGDVAISGSGPAVVGNNNQINQ